jgi:hypothetical protein
MGKSGGIGVEAKYKRELLLPSPVPFPSVDQLTWSRIYDAPLMETIFRAVRRVKRYIRWDELIRVSGNDSQTKP